jgi:hypothetical protein
MVVKCLHLLIAIFVCNLAAIFTIVVVDSSIITQSKDTEESNHEAAWAEVEAAASKPPPAASHDVNGSSPKAQFHCLDKALLLKHLREVKAEKTLNGKPFFASYTKWEELSPTQRNKTISFEPD